MPPSSFSLRAVCMLTSSRLRLATHLYAEHLLDREHYMEWLVSGLETCSQAKLPMSLLVTQIYWKDLLRLRKYGRRLVVALLNQNTTVRLIPYDPEVSTALLTTRTDSNSSRSRYPGSTFVENSHPAQDVDDFERDQLHFTLGMGQTPRCPVYNLTCR